MLYCVDNWVICNNSQFEDENKRFLILIDEHIGESSILLFPNVYAFLIESEWFSETSMLINSFSCCSL
jgi:hypothetical protein